MRFQTSMVFSQRAWPGAGDIDDCWVVADIQALNSVAPWLELVSVPAYRAAAGNPDVQGEADGGQLRDSVRAVRALWPEYGATTRARPQVPWSQLLESMNEGRPISLSVVSGELPAELRFGFQGYHRIAMLRTPGGRHLFANPLAPIYSRWIEVDQADIRPAALAYGEAKAGKAVAYGVTFPTLAETIAIYAPATATPPPDDGTPFDQADLDASWNEALDAATAALGDVPRR